MPNAIEFAEITKRYGAATALDGISAHIPPGQVVGLLGHNGAGKTTLMKLALGLINPTNGRACVLGLAPNTVEFREARSRIGYLPENVAFYGNLTGREIIDYLARLKGAPAGEAGVLLERVGLAAAADRRIRTYSKGMRQRVGLAQALLGSPDLFLFDEPTTGLDPSATRQFFELVNQLRASGKTVVISSHLLAELEPHLDSALILKNGKLVAHGTIAQMYDAAGLADTITIRFSGKPNGLLREAWISTLPSPPRMRGPSVVELDVPQARKLDVMRHLMGSRNLSDIVVREPSLVRLYTTISSAAPAASDKVNSDEQDSRRRA
ncbi:MAG: ABC transporter ATP-binding protein [Alphaproteobacteria bacterium]|nr:ABC transporter ATP-binding protein [Alphaproteobacteria bacterium]